MTENTVNVTPLPAYEGWAIVELMGRSQTAGLVREVQMAGVTVLRVDTPGLESGMLLTQFYGGAAIYCLTPCDEAAARQVLANRPHNLPEAVRLVLPPLAPGEDDIEF